MAFVTGLHPNEYWEITFGELMDFIAAFNERRELQIKDQDRLNHALGNYIRIAFHNQKRYPRESFSDRQSKKQVFTSDDQRMRMARAKYGVHHGNNR